MPDLDAATRRYLTACTAELMPDVRGEARAVLVDLVHARSADALIDHVHGLLHVVLAAVGFDDDEDEDDDALLQTLGRVVDTVLNAAAGKPPCVPHGCRSRGPAPVGGLEDHPPIPRPSPSTEKPAIDVVAEVVDAEKEDAK